MKNCTTRSIAALLIAVASLSIAASMKVTMIDSDGTGSGRETVIELNLSTDLQGKE